MEKLTEKQLKLLRYIVDRLEGNDSPSQREIARHFGVAQNAICQLISYLRKKGYLENYTGHRRITLSQTYLNKRSRPQGIPIVGRVAAGAPILAEENIDGCVDLKEFVRPDGDAFILKVRGDSMVDAGILDGDMVVVEPGSQIGNGQIGVCLVNGEVTVKRIYIQRDRIVLEPANKSGAYKTLNVEKNNETVRIIGKVTGCIRKL